MNRKAWLVAAALLTTDGAQATCYSIYKADGTLLQQSSTSPVNLTLQIGDTVPEKFGSGAVMTVSDYDVFCPDASERRQAPQSLADAVLEGEKKGAQVKAKKGAAAAAATRTAAKQGAE